MNRTSQDWHPKHQGPIGDGTKNQPAPRLAGSRRHTQRGRPGSRRGKTYRDVDTGVSWDAP
ncbi:hypothetical protein [Corynebacterium matruchotii]|uniref:hypothetical protein n=1 Tax=Corynebacterium matruchotii TaxID=43768 RepID=UPI000317F946|nr:hypothetical protein [Corynebacterium matruchotii]